MDLAYFTMPLHPMGRDYGETLAEDREAIILADALGYTEAFFGEHAADALENVPSSLLMIASLIHSTKTIKLGSGTVNLPHHHPVQVAGQVAMIDHMLRGRFIFGIGVGALRADNEVYDMLGRNRTEMMLESIEHIIAIWNTDPPYNLKGKYWNITTEETYLPERGQGVLPRCYQKPHPPIVVAVVEPYSKGVTEAAKRGWTPISANFLLPQWVKTHWPKYVEGRQAVGGTANPADWRVAKSIFVADDDATAREYGRGVNGPYYHYYEQLIYKLVKAGRGNLFKKEQSLPDDAATVDNCIGDLVICGTVNSVVDQLLAFREHIGDFGTLLYAGHDWRDRALAKRSMELMATEVMPAVNKAIGLAAAAE